MTTAPLQMSFEVACSPQHAFDVWTSRIGTWWPTDHTVSGTDDVVVVLQSGVGGRIFERTAEGVEHDWGEVTVWEPPAKLGYLWHIGRDRSTATEVQICFVPRGETTLIEIEHRGWEQLGTEGDEARERNQFGWQTVMPHFLEALQEGDA
jgi:uncharacterized protein YndB with AHSA1/START domain